MKRAFGIRGQEDTIAFGTLDPAFRTRPLNCGHEDGNIYTSLGIYA